MADRAAPVSEEQSGKRPPLPLPGFSQSFEPFISCKESAAQGAGMFQKFVIFERAAAVLDSCQDVYTPEP